MGKEKYIWHDIRELRETGISYKKIADKLSLKYESVRSVLSRGTWANVDQ